MNYFSINFYFCCVYFILFIYFYQKNDAKNQALNKLNNREEFTPLEFVDMYKNLKHNKIKISNIDQSGCYVFLNKTKNIYYVGQSKNVLKRINQHLNTKRNGDVYVDLKYEINLLYLLLNVLNMNLI